MATKPSFETLIDEYGREVFAYLWRLFHGQDAAEDCFQETFLRAFKAYPRLRSSANLRAWLYKIASNTAFTQMKKENRLAGKGVELTDEQPSTELSVADQVSDRLLLTEVAAAIRSLPEKQQAALLMRKYQGLSYREIGRALDSSPAAARANAYQALRKLRVQFAALDQREH